MQPGSAGSGTRTMWVREETARAATCEARDSIMEHIHMSCMGAAITFGPTWQQMSGCVTRPVSEAAGFGRRCRKTRIVFSSCRRTAARRSCRREARMSLRWKYRETDDKSGTILTAKRSSPPRDCFRDLVEGLFLPCQRALTSAEGSKSPTNKEGKQYICQPFS